MCSDKWRGMKGTVAGLVQYPDAGCRTGAPPALHKSISSTGRKTPGLFLPHCPLLVVIDIYICSASLVVERALPPCSASKRPCQELTCRISASLDNFLLLAQQSANVPNSNHTCGGKELSCVTIASWSTWHLLCSSAAVRVDIAVKVPQTDGWVLSFVLRAC